MQAAAAHAHGTREAIWPQDAQFGRASAGKIAMWIFLVSDGLSFAGLLLAYEAALRGERKRTALLLGLTALGGALFLLGQYSEYFGILHPGLTKEGLVF